MTIEVGSKLPLTTSFQVLKDGKPTVRWFIYSVAFVVQLFSRSGRSIGVIVRRFFLFNCVWYHSVVQSVRSILFNLMLYWCVLWGRWFARGALF